jgi:hypothetical protein
MCEPIDPACAGKHPHPSRAKAGEIARQMQRRTGQSLPQVYRCETCRSWHIGHSLKRMTRPITKKAHR